jgi:hypothetical protein
MRTDKFLFAPLLLLATVPAGAADLSKLDRTLRDEPKYAPRTPTYCLLVFGQEADTHVWLVRDGEVMHVLDSPDGKAAKKWRQVKGSYNSFALGDVWEEGGKTRHKNLRYHSYIRFARLSVVVGTRPQMAGRDYSGKLEFAASPKDAPVVHFNGPLTLDLFWDQEPFYSGQPGSLDVVVGTRGVGKGTFAAINCGAYPKGAWPSAVIGYPAKDGGKPIIAKVRLAEE